MMGSVSLIMIAFALGGLMEKTGLIAALLQGLIKGVHTKGRLVMAPPLLIMLATAWSPVLNAVPLCRADINP
jgi:Na+/H+ antiporter NhaC